MDELLSVLLNKKTVSMPELSEELPISKEFIYAKLERYEQLGYVKRVVENGSLGCSGNCSGCSGCGSTKLNLSPSVYWIKGDKLK